MTRKRYEIVCSTFDKKGRHIATSRNDYKKSHPLMLHFAKIAGESCDKIWKHAELSACLESGNTEIHSVLVQRFDAFGKPKTAKPCKICQAMLKGFGVHIARYTTDFGIKEELVKEMK